MNIYWWVGLLIFLLFVGINVVVFLLRKNQKLSYYIAYFIALFLLTYKIIEYSYYQIKGDHMMFPLEFSALSYFILGITFVFKIKKIEPFGAFVGILAGLTYSVGFWISPDSFLITHKEPPFLFTMALLNHHLLYFSATLMLMNVRKYNYKDAWIQVVGVGVMVAYSWTLYKLTDFAKVNGKPIIIQISDGSILKNIGFPDFKPWMIAVYLIIAIILVLGMIALFYYLNYLLSKNRQSLE